MPIKFQLRDISDIYFGTRKIDFVYIGSAKVYESWKTYTGSTAVWTLQSNGVGYNYTSPVYDLGTKTRPMKIQIAGEIRNGDSYAQGVNFSIEVSNDGNNWTTAATYRQEMAAGGSASVYLQANLSGEVNWRYLRYRVDGKHHYRDLRGQMTQWRGR